jgi:hypothetical protein
MLDRMNDLRSDGKDLTPSVIDSDCRGRVAVADSNLLKFFCGFGMLNSRYVATYGKASRSKISTISTISIGFVVKGLKFVPDFDNSIFIWGSEKAKVVMMTNNLTMIATEKDLVINRPDQGRSEIINCRWIVGSGTCIAVGCTNQVFIYNISLQGCSIQPILTISSLTKSSSLHDFAVVRVTENRNSNKRHWKIFATLQNKKLQLTTILQDRNGIILEEDATDCQDAPTPKESDIRCDTMGSIVALPRHLYYFEKSNVLIYETDSANVEVLFLTENGSISRIATLLPFRFSLDSSGSGDSVNVYGPFTCWNEISSIRRAEEDFFRAVCVGRLEKSNAEALILVEFSTNLIVNIQLLVEKTTIHDESVHSFIGLTVYTAPMLKAQSNTSAIHPEKRFTEHIIICALTRSGNLETYVEKVGALSLPILKPSCYDNTNDLSYCLENELVSLNDMERSLDIVAIEDFVNISDSDEVIIGGADIGT